MTNDLPQKNPELDRFIEHVGSVNGAASTLGVSTDMLQKMRNGHRTIMPKHAITMDDYVGFRLSWRKLYRPDQYTTAAVA